MVHKLILKVGKYFMFQIYISFRCEYWSTRCYLEDDLCKWTTCAWQFWMYSGFIKKCFSCFDKINATNCNQLQQLSFVYWWMVSSEWADVGISSLIYLNFKTTLPLETYIRIHLWNLINDSPLSLDFFFTFVKQND